MTTHSTDKTLDHSTATAAEMPTYENIAHRAFQLYEHRGANDGYDLEDWLEAERQLLLERLPAIGEFAAN